jgi:hypothetical protein
MLRVAVIPNDTGWTAQWMLGHTPVRELPEVSVAKVSGGSRFVFRPRKSLPLTVV